MHRIVLALVVLTGASSLLGASVAQGKQAYQLKGEVYASGFKIEMKTAANRKLKTVKAGTYRIKIEDHATIHNFHLEGPGVNKRTSVAGRSETIWTLRLRPGKYTFVCDPHGSMMRGSFRVT